MFDPPPRHAKLSGKPGCGSAWLERCVRDAEVAGSNPVTPIEEALSANPAGEAFLLDIVRSSGFRGVEPPTEVLVGKVSADALF